MKVYAISDLHLSINNPKPMDIFGGNWDNYVEKIVKSWNRKVKNDDIVLIAGDISWAMNLSDAMPDIEFISKLKGNKVIIKGNHDYWWHSVSALRNVLPDNFYALQNDAIKIGKVVICGSRGWVVPDDGNYKSEEDEKLFKREVMRMELSLKSADSLREKGDTLILMTHFPPYNAKYQSNDMTKLFEKYCVDKVVYGHLHTQDKRHKLKFTKNKIQYYLTSCDQINNNLVKIN
ncbi:MAG: serine/threonine protein phosphatase [Clostridiales bacterium]|nr:serine/threonine protein phosphatase [Clostridiales bacterium]